MSGVAQRRPPHPRRLAVALERIAAEAQDALSHGSHELSDWRAFVIRGQQKVLDHYRKLLATHDMPYAERAWIRQRIARTEAELAAMTGPSRASDADPVSRSANAAPRNRSASPATGPAPVWTAPLGERA